MGDNKIQALADPRVLLKTKRFEVVELDLMTPRGRHLRPMVKHPGAVTIIPMVDDDHVCLIRNFRYTVHQTLIELPAGTLEPPEPPLACAQRELLEETGYRAAKIEPLHSFFLSPGILDEHMHLFVATGLEPGETAREIGEQIENLVVPWSEALRLVAAGEIRDAKSLVGILLYDFLRKRRGG